MAKSKWRSRQIITLMIIVAAILLFLLLIRSPSAVNDKRSQEKSWLVNAVTIKKGAYQPNLILYGVIESPQSTVIEASINADVLETPVLEGESVKKNDLLIRLDDRETKLLLQQRIAEENELTAQIAAEKNRHQRDLKAYEVEKNLFEINKRAVARQVKLAKQQYGSRSDIENAEKSLHQQELALANRELSINDHQNRIAQLQAKLLRAQALREQAELDLDRTTLESPFNGRVTKLFVSVGSRVQPGESLIRLFDIDEFEIRAQIPNSYVPVIRQSITKKQPLNGIAMIDNTKIPIELSRLAGEVTSSRGGVDAIFSFDTNDNLALGRSTEIHLDLPVVDNAFLIPSTAMYGNQRLYIVNNDKMKSVKVTVHGVIHDFQGSENMIVRSEQLKEGDLIVATQLPNARDGLKITINKR